jgi:hypothetical protein
MIMHFERRVGVVALAAVLPVACASESLGPPPVKDELPGAAWCQAACDYMARCTQTASPTCVSSLQTQDAAFFRNVKPEFLAGFAACLDEAQCAADWSTAAADCLKKVAPGIAPSAGVIAVCKARAAQFFNCNWADADLAVCTQDYAPLTDIAVQRFSDCGVAACKDLQTCTTVAFSG